MSTGKRVKRTAQVLGAVFRARFKKTKEGGEKGKVFTPSLGRKIGKDERIVKLGREVKGDKKKREYCSDAWQKWWEGNARTQESGSSSAPGKRNQKTHCRQSVGGYAANRQKVARRGEAMSIKSGNGPAISCTKKTVRGGKGNKK